MPPALSLLPVAGEADLMAAEAEDRRGRPSGAWGLHDSNLATGGLLGGGDDGRRLGGLDGLLGGGDDLLGGLGGLDGLLGGGDDLLGGLGGLDGLLGGDDGLLGGLGGGGLLGGGDDGGLGGRRIADDVEDGRLHG